MCTGIAGIIFKPLFCFLDQSHRCIIILLPNRMDKSKCGVQKPLLAMCTYYGGTELRTHSEPFLCAKRALAVQFTESHGPSV